MNNPLRIGIAGLGTVGLGVIKILIENQKSINLKCGREIQIYCVSAKNKNIDRGLDISQIEWFDDPVEMASSDAIDVFVELIGGESGVAKKAIEAAIDSGKSIVTANKALIANHAIILAQKTEKAGVNLYFEGAVAGGIPIVKALRDSLSGNNINRIYGIMNGTCNYILSKMEETGLSFEDILKEAKQLGYAENDPSFDIDGIDTAHKLSILTSLAFGTQYDLDKMHIEGIRQINSADILYAAKLGFKIKLLGIVIKTDYGIEQRVHPCMIPEKSPIAHVDGVFNAVYVEGDFVGPSFFQGFGAGSGPTASAVVGDLIDIARGINIPSFGYLSAYLSSNSYKLDGKRKGTWYIRLSVVERPGVLADIAAKLRDHSISIESVLQKRRVPGQPVTVIMTTHEAEEGNFFSALNSIKQLDYLTEIPCSIRIENL